MTAGDRAGVPEPDLTLIVDGANVVGSRPDGWWRDRAGAAVRLYDELAGLAERGAAGIPAAQLATGEDGEASACPGQAGPGRPAESKPAQGKPAQGKPEPGGPAPGRPAQGKPEPGGPAPGRPAQGKPEPGRPAPGRPEPGRLDRAGRTGQATQQDGPQTVAVVLVLEGAAKAAAGGSPPARPGPAGDGPVTLGPSRSCPRPAPATTRSCGWPGPGRGSASWSPPTGNCAAGPWPPAPRWPGRHGYAPSCDVDPRAVAAVARIRHIALKSPGNLTHHKRS